MATSEEWLAVDKATYESVGLVVKMLSKEIISKLQSSAVLTQSKDKFLMTRNELYMGVVISHIHHSHNNSVRLMVKEHNLNGPTGCIFTIDLFKEVSEEFQKNVLSKMNKKTESILILFQKVAYRCKHDGTIEFHITSAKRAKVNLKYFYSSTKDKSDTEYQYTTLQEASDSLAKQCNIYAVVDKIIKEPTITSRQSAHGMYSLVDPSCFDGSLKKKDFLFHVWASSFDTFPKAVQGDVIRIHRAKVEPRSDKLPDFRVFRETDVVVFPLDTNDMPSTAAKSFTFTEKDFHLLNHLKVWSSEVYLNFDDGAEPELVTLEKITCGRPFNLACHLVQHFATEKAVGLWVEDGTVCPLYTCSDSRIEPYSSQDTVDICNSVRLICVHCPKVMVKNLTLENGAFLFLRGVETITNYSDPNIGNVVQFCAKGSVELLPMQTRYSKALIRRLEKCKNITMCSQEESNKDDYNLTENVSMVKAQLQQSVATRMENNNLKSKELNDSEDALGSKRNRGHGGVSNKEVFGDADHLHRTDALKSGVRGGPSTSKESTGRKSNQVGEDSASKRKIRGTNSSLHMSPKQTFVTKHKVLEGSGNRSHFGEGSTDGAMVEIPSGMLDEDYFCSSLQRELEQEETRLSTLINPLVLPQDSDANSVRLLRRIRQTEQTDLNCEENDISFCHVVTSTQKPEVVSSRSTDADKLTEMPNAQPLFAGNSESSNLGQKFIPKRKNTCIVHPVSSLSSDMFDNQLGTVTCSSPQPVYRAASEVLDIETGTSQFIDSRNIHSQKITMSQVDDQRNSQVKLTDGNSDFQIRLSPSQTERTDELMNQGEREPNAQVGKKKSKGWTSGTPKKILKCSEYDSTVKSHLSIPAHKNNETEEDSGGEGTSGKHQSKKIVSDELCRSILDERPRHRTSILNSSCEDTLEPHRLISGTTKSGNACPFDRKMEQENRTRVAGSSESIEEVEIVEDISDSDDDSVIIINSPTQMDLLGFLNAIETSESEDVFLNSPSDSNFILPEKQFRIKTTVANLLPNTRSEKVSHNLSDLIVAYCSSCCHLWQHHHFKNSISNNVRRKKKTTIGDSILGEEFNGVVNYLCSEEEHSQNILRLNENHNILNELDCDEQCEMDYTFHYVCPLCKLDRKPDSMCLLKPSFYFWMHITHNTSCLHVMASGVHAEYFLGTKAEHAVRSPEVWKKAEDRLSKLMDYGKKQPLTLCIRKAQHLNEYYLENTFVVYHNRHILPW